MKWNKWDFYAGVAYEHEVDGKANGIAVRGAASQQRKELLSLLNFHNEGECEKRRHVAVSSYFYNKACGEREI
ncbi:MAG: hypothetical protein E7199_04565 [Schwartzia succinivorans]|nr:hypothetical protein [Schwartzia succinivorans]